MRCCLKFRTVSPDAIVSREMQVAGARCVLQWLFLGDSVAAHHIFPTAPYIIWCRFSAHHDDDEIYGLRNKLQNTEERLTEMRARCEVVQKQLDMVGPHQPQDRRDVVLAAGIRGADPPSSRGSCSVHVTVDLPISLTIDSAWLLFCCGNRTTGSAALMTVMRDPRVQLMPRRAAISFRLVMRLVMRALAALSAWVTDPTPQQAATMLWHDGVADLVLGPDVKRLRKPFAKCALHTVFKYIQDQVPSASTHPRLSPATQPTQPFGAPASTAAVALIRRKRRADGDGVEDP